MPTPIFLRRRRRLDRGFSLVEVALALGIVGFVLAGLIGAIPLASSVGRQSIDQSRAASIAGTVFTTLRAGKFSAVSLQDDGADTIILNTFTTGTVKTYYAYFDEVPTNNTTDERRLHFASNPPAGGTLAYQVTLRFDNYPNRPNPTLAPYEISPGVTHARANAVEVSINSLARPKDVSRFSSVVANRAE